MAAFVRCKQDIGLVAQEVGANFPLAHVTTLVCGESRAAHKSATFCRISVSHAADPDAVHGDHLDHQVVLDAHDAHYMVMRMNQTPLD